MRVLFIQTGGTIDKDYPARGVAYHFVIADPAVKRILASANPSFKYRIQELLKKDSTDLTDDDRQLIVEACRAAPESKIIVTHGTDTMVETAKALSKVKKKIIILTGSMRPERFKDSDASFHVGSAVAALPFLEHGTYIAMNGRVLPWNKIRKYYGDEENQFIKTEPKT